MSYIFLNQLKKKELIKIIEERNKQISILNKRIEYLNYLVNFYEGNKKSYPERLFEYINEH